MDDRKPESRVRAGLAASVVAAVGASICCIGPIAAAFLGFTSLAALVKYESLRPVFSVINLSFLGSAFYLAYRKRICLRDARDSDVSNVVELAPRVREIYETTRGHHRCSDHCGVWDSSRITDGNNEPSHRWNDLWRLRDGSQARASKDSRGHRLDCFLR